MWSNYDQWKLRSPDDERDPEPEFWCSACEDAGWIGDNGRAIPCTECSAELTADDLEQIPA